MNFGQHSDINAKSHLRILYAGTKQTYSVSLSKDSFTQTNPPIVKDLATVSDLIPKTPPYGVLSSSIAFTRPDEGNGVIGDP